MDQGPSEIIFKGINFIEIGPFPFDLIQVVNHKMASPGKIHHRRGKTFGEEIATGIVGIVGKILISMFDMDPIKEIGPCFYVNPFPQRRPKFSLNRRKEKSWIVIAQGKGDRVTRSMGKTPERLKKGGTPFQDFRRSKNRRLFIDHIG